LSVEDESDIEGFAHKLPETLDIIREKKVQAYPPFSSKTVDGKPLFEWAREKRIEEIDIPKRNINITHLRHSHTRLVSTKEILEEILERIDKVRGDFRQDEIKDAWINALGNKLDGYMILSSFDADVSSGTYIRSLAHEMGILMGSSAIAYRIKRTRIGEYNIGPFA
jgi:tRNA U55 pseudouridine synthase TruB